MGSIHGFGQPLHTNAQTHTHTDTLSHSLTHTHTNIVFVMLGSFTSMQLYTPNNSIRIWHRGELTET